MDYDKIIRSYVDRLIFEVDKRDEIMKKLDFWDGNTFFLEEEDKTILDESYKISDTCTRLIKEVREAQIESQSSVFIAFRGK